MAPENIVLKILDFCLSPAQSLVLDSPDNINHVTFVKRAFGQDVDILYYEPQTIARDFNRELKYCGFYSKITGRFYDLTFYLCDQSCIGRHGEECNDCPELITSFNSNCESLHQLENKVSELLTKKLLYVFRHTEVFLPYLGDKYPDIENLKAMAEEKARKAFLHNRDLDDKIRFKPNIKFADVIEYLHFKDEGITRIFENYMQENAIQLYTEAAVYKLANVFIHEINEQKDLSLLCLRALTILNDGFYTQEAKNKTCEITIDKDGKEFTFKRRSANIFEYDFHKLLSKSQKEYVWCFGSPDNKYSYTDIKRIVRQAEIVYDRDKVVSEKFVTRLYQERRRKQ